MSLHSFAIERGGARVVFAAGARRTIGAELARFDARRVLVVTSAGRRRAADDVARPLGERCVGTVATAVQHVPETILADARKALRDARPDWLMAIGGGSTIGLAKALALEFEVGVAAVPTTYAGSEMTSIYGLKRDGLKVTGRSPRVKPRLVLYDPELTLDLPLATTIASGINAMAHALPALSASGVDPLLQTAAERALAALCEALPALARTPRSLPARTSALYGAHLAANCLSGAPMGLHHALCHVIGGRQGTRHAATHCALLAHVLATQTAPTVAAVARALRAAPEDGAGALFDFIADLAGPTALSSLGVGEDQLRDIAAQTASGRSAGYGTGKELSEADVLALLQRAWSGHRPPARNPPKLAPSAARSRAPHAPRYLSGFSATLQSEALPGALPRTQNSPNPAPYGLFAESVNGTPFTTRRAQNQRSWLYRIRPSVLRGPAKPWQQPRFTGAFDGFLPVASLVRWRPLPVPGSDRHVDFLAGLTTIGGAGDPDTRVGYAIHAYACNGDMDARCLVDHDGHLLLVPERGRLHLQTEFGWLHVGPGEVAVVQRGLAFAVHTPDGEARGYVLETFGRPFQLPERGPIGANGLADARHFLAPTAAYEDRPCDYRIIVKQSGALFAADRGYSPFDVVAWHGNYVPYKYDLALFNTMGSVSFDHADPSLYTVLTCPLDETGAALADFVIFPGRWDVSEHTFRPPYYHRNIATEFSGIVKLTDPYAGFEQGCYFLTPSLAPHGVSADGYRSAIVADDKPVRQSDESLWILFESALGIRLSPWAAEADNLDTTYRDIWNTMPVRFTGEPDV